MTAPAYPVTGRCYCGATTLRAERGPRVVAWCHCPDCRRSSGAPAAAFAAFDEADLSVTPSGPSASAVPGSRRWFCADCGSPVAARYDYLPGQVYVPLGLLDQAADLAPQMHSHADACLPWLHIDDDLPRNAGSSRDELNAAARTGPDR